MSEEKCEFNMQGWCCCGLTTVLKEIGYADILCSDECNKNCYYKQLQTAKWENEKLKKRLERYKKQSDMLLSRNKKLSEILINNKVIRNKNAEIDNLTQQNKQMREALEKIVDIKNSKQIFYSSCDLDDCFDIAQQALKGGE